MAGLDVDHGEGRGPGQGEGAGRCRGARSGRIVVLDEDRVLQRAPDEPFGLQGPRGVGPSPAIPRGVEGPSAPGRLTTMNRLSLGADAIGRHPSWSMTPPP